MFGGRFGFARFSLRGVELEDVAVEASFSESISSQVTAGINTFIEASFSESISSQILISIGVPLSADFAEALFTLVRAAVMEIFTFEINTAIPPGGELRIDSEQFEVTLNGASIIHLHNGDWVNISRDTLNIDISSSATLNGQLIYLERFL